MHLHLIRTALATAALCANFSAAAHESDGKLGSVHFKVSCNAEAQREFDLAMAYYHSFAWEQIRAPLGARPGLAGQPLRLAGQCVRQDAGRG